MKNNQYCLPEKFLSSNRIKLVTIDKVNDFR